MKFCMDIIEQLNIMNEILYFKITNMMTMAISEVKPSKRTTGRFCKYVISSSQSKTANNSNHSSSVHHNSMQ
jgi:hypothetical protein